MSRGARTVVISTALALVFVLDRFLKFLAHDGRTGEVFGIRFALVENSGIAFSLPLSGVVLTLATAIVLLIVGALAVRRWRAGAPWIAWALVFVGGASNLLDRIRHDAVVDYLAIAFFPVFNLADLLIALGLLSLLVKPLTRRTARA